MVPYKRIFTGSSCNNRCLYCHEKNKISSPECADLVSSLSRDRDGDSLEFHGGEPTIRKDFFSMVDAARNQGYKRIKVVTNARTLADVPTAIKTVEAGCYFFEIKVHHHRPDIHDYVTQTPGSLKETVQGLVNLRRINTLHQAPFSAFISLRISLSSKNHEDSGAIIAAFIPYKIDRFILAFDDSALELSKALPHIKNAIDLSVLNRVWITTQNIPLCTLPGYEHHVSEAYHSPDGNFKKAATCRECHLDACCPGLKTAYADTYGFNELKPFRKHSHLIDDIRNLANASR